MWQLSEHYTVTNALNLHLIGRICGLYNIHTGSNHLRTIQFTGAYFFQKLDVQDQTT